MERSRGANLFTGSWDGQKYYLIVSAKRKACCFVYERGTFVFLREHSLSDGVKAMALVYPHCCLGLKKDYQMLHLETGELADIFSTRGNTPSVTCLSVASSHPSVSSSSQHKKDVTEFLLGLGDVSVAIGVDRKPTRKINLTWSEKPLAIVSHAPYVIAALPSALEVWDDISQSTLQSLPLRQIESLILGTSEVIQPVRAGRGAVAGKFGPVALWCASTTAIRYLATVPLQRQVSDLTAAGKWKDALQLALHGATDQAEQIAPGELNMLRVSAAWQCAAVKDWEGACNLWLEAKLNPRHVMILHGESCPESVATSNPSLHVTVTQTMRGVLRTLNGTQETALLEALSSYLGAWHRWLWAEVSQQSQHKQQQTSQTDSPTVAAGNGNGNGNGNALPFEWDMGESQLLLQLVDTMLLKVFLRVKPALVPVFLRAPNAVTVEVAVPCLKKAGRLDDLVTLLSSRKLHDQALTLLASTAQESGEFRGLVHYLQNLHLSHLPLILEFSKLVIAKNPTLGLSIFLDQDASNSKAEKDISSSVTSSEGEARCLPVDSVLKFLKKTDASLCIPFLESVSSSPCRPLSDLAVIHNELLVFYLKRLKKDPDYEKYAKKGHSLRRAGSEPGEFGVRRRQLLAFLESSLHYMPEKMLARFPIDELHEERAVLLSRIGQDARALEIYARELGQHDLALEYCAKIYEESSRDRREEVYLALFHVYIRSNPPMLDQAMDLLNKFHHRLDAAAAMDGLPDSASIAQVAPFLLTTLRQASQDRHAASLRKYILRAQVQEQKTQLVALHNRRIYVDSSVGCCVCGKAIGEKRAFVRNPNGDILHLMCRDDASKR